MSSRVHSFHDVLRNGTEVKESITVSNGTAIVYTVPSGYTLYIDSINFGVDNTSGARRVVYMAERDELDALVEYMKRFGILDNWCLDVSQTYPTLYTVAADYDVYIVSPAANCFVFGTIHGWLI